MLQLFTLNHSVDVSSPGFQAQCLAIFPPGEFQQIYVMNNLDYLPVLGMQIDSLHANGRCNMSSVFFLHIWKIKMPPPKPGKYGILAHSWQTAAGTFPLWLTLSASWVCPPPDGPGKRARLKLKMQSTLSTYCVPGSLAEYGSEPGSHPEMCCSLHAWLVEPMWLYYSHTIVVTLDLNCVLSDF